MNRISLEQRKREDEICNKIQEAVVEISRLDKEGKNTEGAYQRLEAVLREFEQFKRETY